MTEVSVEIDVGPVLPFAVFSEFEPAPANLAAAPVAGGGTFAAGNYFWVVTGTDSYGETTASNEATAAIALNGSANLTWGPLPPGTTGVKVYRGTASNGENALIATLGAVIAFTDTGAAGTANTPPTANTAQIGDQLVVSGPAALVGWSMRETSGTASANIDFLSGGNSLGTTHLASGNVDTQIIADEGVLAGGGIDVHVRNGTFVGTLYVRLKLPHYPSYLRRYDVSSNDHRYLYWRCCGHHGGYRACQGVPAHG